MLQPSRPEEAEQQIYQQAPLDNHDRAREGEQVNNSVGDGGTTEAAQQAQQGRATQSYREEREEREERESPSASTTLSQLAQLAHLLAGDLAPEETLARLAQGALALLPQARAILIYAAPDTISDTTDSTDSTDTTSSAPILLHRATRAASHRQGRAGGQHEQPAPASAADALPAAVWRTLGATDVSAVSADARRIALPLREEHERLAGALVIQRDTHHDTHHSQHRQQRQQQGEGGNWPTGAAPELTILAGYVEVALERRAHARQVAQLAEEMHEQDRLRDSFLSLAAHELRSPLTAVKGYAQLAQRQARKQPIPEAMMRSLVAIEQQTNRMSEMIGELHDATRLRRNAFELIRAPVELAPIVRQVVERSRARFPLHTITLDGDTGDDAAPLVGQWDVLRVEQVLRDLVENAARYSPTGGAISVSLARQDGDACVAIRDEGVGVAPEDSERIFEYLYRAPNAEERNLSGLGLGLFVSRAIVERLGGRLWLAASPLTPKGGAEFRLTLPLSDPPTR